MFIMYILFWHFALLCRPLYAACSIICLIHYHASLLHRWDKAGNPFLWDGIPHLLDFLAYLCRSFWKWVGWPYVMINGVPQVINGGQVIILVRAVYGMYLLSWSPVWGGRSVGRHIPTEKSAHDLGHRYDLSLDRFIHATLVIESAIQHKSII